MLKTVRCATRLLALLFALVLAGCGGSGAVRTEGPTVPVEHRYGTTQVPENPQRVVTLGLSDQQAALAVGIKPVGVVDWFKERPYGKWPWTKDVWGPASPEIVGEREEYDLEKVAQLRPDVIIAAYSGMSRQQYDLISKIAPVVAQPKGFDPYLAPWQDLSVQVAKGLGKEHEMGQRIAQVEQRFAEVRQQHPEWAQQTVAVADSFTPGVYDVFTSADAKALFFEEMGFRLVDGVDEQAIPGTNSLKLSSERLTMLDVDHLVWVTEGEQTNERIRNEPLYQRLRVHQDGRDEFVPYENPDVGAAFSFNTVLSIPYAIDQLVPMLER